MQRGRAVERTPHVRGHAGGSGNAAARDTSDGSGDAAARGAHGPAGEQGESGARRFSARDPGIAKQARGWIRLPGYSPGRLSARYLTSGGWGRGANYYDSWDRVAT
jgi:hypothetical protein